MVQPESKSDHRKQTKQMPKCAVTQKQSSWLIVIIRGNGIDKDMNHWLSNSTTLNGTVRSVSDGIWEDGKTKSVKKYVGLPQGMSDLVFYSKR